MNPQNPSETRPQREARYGDTTKGEETTDKPPPVKPGERARTPFVKQGDADIRK